MAALQRQDCDDCQRNMGDSDYESDYFFFINTITSNNQRLEKCVRCVLLLYN